MHVVLYLMLSLYILPVPSAPRDLTLESVSTDATLLMASWAHPMPANGVITAYTLYCTGVEEQFYEDQFVPEEFSLSLGGNVLSTTLENLLPFTVYECYITASTSAGEGDESSPVMRRTNETCTFTIEYMYTNERCMELHVSEFIFTFFSLSQLHLTALRILYVKLSTPHPFNYLGSDPQHPMEL